MENQLCLQKKINVLFLVNELFINNFISVYERVKNSNCFSITVITCASLSTDYKEEISSAKIYNYLKENKIDCIDGYDSSKNCYIDLVQFNPDYIFVSTPYDIYRPKEYSSSNLSKIAKLCAIEYGAIIVNNVENVLLNNKFYFNCYYSFINSEKELDSQNVVNNEQFQKIKSKFIPVGCVKLDKYLYDKYEKNHWEKLFNGNNLNRLRITWKPRWTVEKQNEFFKMLKEFINYCKNNMDRIELLLLEHPLLRTNLKSKSLLKKYEKIIRGVPNNLCIYKGSDFLDYVLESDVLVGENTSLMAEFSITNNPIIYVGEYSELNGLGKLIIEQDNVVKNFKQISNIIDKLEHRANIEYSNTKLFANNEKSADYLLQVLKNDYITKNNYYRDIVLKYSDEINKLKKILIQGYYEDLLDNNIEDFAVIAHGLKIWNDEIIRLKTNMNNKK